MESAGTVSAWKRILGYMLGVRKGNAKPDSGAAVYCKDNHPTVKLCMGECVRVPGTPELSANGFVFYLDVVTCVMGGFGYDPEAGDVVVQVQCHDDEFASNGVVWCTGSITPVRVLTPQEIHVAVCAATRVTLCDFTRVKLKHGKFHCDTGPAAVHANGQLDWFTNGLCTRVEHHTPQYVSTVMTYDEGVLHSSNDEPAVVVTRTQDGARLMQIWYKKGRRHRGNDEPAMMSIEGSMEWRTEGKLHRDHGLPAKLFVNDERQYEGASWYVQGRHEATHTFSKLPNVLFLPPSLRR